MRVVVVTPPAPFVVLATAKAHLRVEDDDDNALIEAFIAAACAHIDGPDGWLGRALGEQVLELRFAADELACRFSLPLGIGPVSAIASFKYDDADAVEQTFDAASYRLTADDQLELLDSVAWPDLRRGADAGRVRFAAGSAVIPPAVIAAVLLMVGDLYAFRETAVVGPIATAVPMSATVENLLSPLRKWA